MIHQHLFFFLLASISGINSFSPIGPHTGTNPRSPTTRKAHVSTSDLVDIDDSNYNAILSENNFVLVDAYAKWCGPCRLMENIVSNIADEWKGNLAVARYDVEDVAGKEVKMDLLFQNVMPSKLPAFILFQKGSAVGERAGMLTKEEMEEFLANHSVPRPIKGRISLVSADHAESYMLSSP